MSVSECIGRNREACNSIFGKDTCAGLAGESLPLSEVGIDIPESWQCE